MHSIPEAPLISAIIPAYNHELYVVECLRSLLEQDYSNIELIIINDGSSDSTDAAIRGIWPECEAGFARVTHITRSNMGLTKTLNEGLQLAQGDYVLFMASDDKLADASALTRLFTALQSSTKHAITHGNMRFVDEKGTPFYQSFGGNWLGKRYYGMHPQAGFYNTLLAAKGGACYPAQVAQFGSYESMLLRYKGTPISLCRKQALAACGGFDETHRTAEDLALALKLIRAGHTIHFIDDVVGDYRLHGKNISITRCADMWADVLDVVQSQEPYCSERGMRKLWKHSFARAVLFLMLTRKWPYLAGRLGRFHMCYYVTYALWYDRQAIVKILSHLFRKAR